MLTRSLVTRLIPAFLLLVPLHGVHAQGAMPPASWSGSTGRVLEGLYTQYRLDTDGGDRVVVDGVGARVMWSPAADAGRNDLASRSALGVFATYTPQQRALGFSTLHAGATMDLVPLPTPLFGRVDPVLSLGAGIFRTDVHRPGASRAPLADRRNTTFALSPGVGARIGLWRGFGLRADVHDMIIFRGGTRHNIALDAGLSLSF